MINKPLVGVVGKAGSGKDTVANYLKENYGFVHLSLAEPIKDFAKDLFGFSKEQLWGSSSNRDKEIKVDWSYTWKQFDKHSRYWLEFFNSIEYLPQLRDWLTGLNQDCPHIINARRVAQTLGTEFGRNTVNKDIWINHLLQRAEFYMFDSEFSGIVTSDVRFENEMQKIHSKQGKIIRLLRNKNNHTGIPGHQSEVEQDLVSEDLFDFVIDNNGPISDLYEALNIYMKVIHAPE